MHTIQLYLDENLGTRELVKLRQELMHIPHVVDVEVNLHDHHDMLVEYEEGSGMPMTILDRLRQDGLHANVVSA